MIRDEHAFRPNLVNANHVLNALSASRLKSGELLRELLEVLRGAQRLIGITAEIGDGPSLNVCQFGRSAQRLIGITAEIGTRPVVAYTNGQSAQRLIGITAEIGWFTLGHRVAPFVYVLNALSASRLKSVH